MIVRDKDKGFVSPFAGVARKTLAVGEKGLLSKFMLAAGAQLQSHSHPHEQIGYLINGEIVLVIGQQEYRLLPGDSWAIPSGAVHSVDVIQPAEIIEVFVPVREDFLD